MLVKVSARAESIYALPIGERWLLTSPQSGSSALVNLSAVAAVAACTLGGKAAPSRIVRRLWRQLSRGCLRPAPDPDSQRKLVIIPTRACNMRCVYCDFGAPGSRERILDPRLACRLIDHVAAQPTEIAQGMLRIHFFGGEPMVARRCVETVIHYARMVCARKGLIPWFELTTNGLLDTTAVPFVGDYIDSVVISLDGEESMHDANRPLPNGGGTFAAIADNIRQLSRFPVELSLRTCITDRSVNRIPEITSYLCSEFEFDLLCFETLAPNQSTRAAGIGPPDAALFAAGVLKAEAVAEAHGVAVIHGPSELAGPRATSCPLGHGTLMLNPEGLVTACYLETERWKNRGLDLVVGHVDPVCGPEIELGKLANIAGLLQSKPRCARCFCRSTCAGGCHIEQTPPGCSLDYDDRCRATRLITGGRLLRQLEGTPAVESFTDDPAAMLSLMEHPDDRLSAWIPK